MIVVKESVFTSILILIALSYDHVMVSAQEDDIILVRTEPDPTSQELPCANQTIVYECQQLISSDTLTWTLPNNDTLRFSILRDINDIEPSDDDNYIATLTNKIEGDETDTFFFTSTLMILEPVNGSTVRCTGGTTPQVSNDITIILSGPPDPPTDLSYDNTVIIESSVDLQWNRPSYTGGVPIVNYIVSIDDMNIMNTSNEMITLTLPENITGNVDIHLLVTAINLCGLESEASENITIPARAPPSITELMYGFTCDVSLEVISLEISWTSEREEGVIYPDIINTSIELRQVLSGLIIEQLCSDDSHTTCTVDITRDEYRLTVIQINDINRTSTMYQDDIDTRILIATNVMLSEDDDILSVTLSVNEECPSDTRYPVLVTFGTQPVDGGDCVGQMNATVMTISPGDSVTFSVDTFTKEDNEVYCYIVSINGTIVINGTVSPDHDFPLGLVVGVSVAGVVIIATPIGAIIIVVIVVVRHKRKKKEKNEVIEEKVADKEDGENGDRKCSIFICCKGRETDGQELKPLSTSSDPASPVTKDPSSAEAGPTYEDPNSITRTPHPSTGQVYTDVNLDKKKNKKQENTTGAAVYQDPNTIKHEVAPSGEMYAMPQTKGKKKKKASDDDGAVGKELTKEEKAALYSVPDRKGQKAKSAGLTYADIDIKASARPAPPSQGSQYVQVKHD